MVNQQTLDAYKAAGVEYTAKAEDEYLKTEREKCSVDLENFKQGRPSTVKRKITAMYRHRTDEGQEFLLYNQTVYATTNITRNPISWHERATETSMYFNPIPERIMSYDQETEKQTSQVKQIQHTEMIFTIPFSEQEVMKLKPFTNLATKYAVTQQDGLTRTVPKFEDWLNMDFEDLITGLTSANFEGQQHQEQQLTIEQPQGTTTATTAKTRVSK